MTKYKTQASLILPTYNEAGHIVQLINQLRQVLKSHHIIHQIILVDDHSPDGTGPLVQQQFHRHSSVQVIIRQPDRGLASAIRTGIDQATGQVILVMDTDFNHDPQVVPELISQCHHHDLVIGSRFVPGGGMASFPRKISSLLYNRLIVRPVLPSPVSDNLSGFFAVKHSRLQQLDFNQIFTGYGDYFIRLIFSALKNHWSITEVPFYHAPRKSGTSKSRLVQLLFQYTWSVIRLRLRSRNQVSYPSCHLERSQV